MKTFLPFEDFHHTAEALDDRRLARQRSDVVAILKKLTEPETEEDHAAIKMWRGHEALLIQYGTAICLEYRARGNNDQTLERIMEFASEFESTCKKPEWLGDIKFHRSNQSYLSRSLPSHYKPQWPEVPDDIPLVWPRSPEKEPKSQELREKQRLIKRAHKMKEKAEKAAEEARQAAETAGLDPDTMELLPDSEVEMVTIGTPDPDLLEL